MSPEAVPDARRAQVAWGGTSVSGRLPVFVRARQALADRESGLGRITARCRGSEEAEVLVSEVLPLAESCRFLEREAVRLLAPVRHGVAGRPLWLGGVRSVTHRVPRGIVLVIAPSNYPLFLPGAQALQALAAGNAVWVKPAPGTREVMVAFGRILAAAGLPEGLFTVLEEDIGVVPERIRQGADLVVLTGGTDAGRAVLGWCAEALIPATVELSGLDACHVLADADVDRTARVLGYALGLNAGRTCIAPRRIFVHRQRAEALRKRFRTLAATEDAVATRLKPWVAEAVREALKQGAGVVAGGWNDGDGSVQGLLVLERVPESSRLWTEDHFSPVAVWLEVADEEEAQRRDSACPFALGASVFGNDLRRAEGFAVRLPAPVVTVNDAVVPTADPRLAFGGTKRSGFGVTRGAEGLLGMTVPKEIACRPSGGWLPHLDAPAAGDAERFRELLNLLHGRGMVGRWGSLWRLLRAGSGKPISNPAASGRGRQQKITQA